MKLICGASAYDVVSSNRMLKFCFYYPKRHLESVKKKNIEYVFLHESLFKVYYALTFLEFNNYTDRDCSKKFLGSINYWADLKTKESEWINVLLG